MNFVVDFEENKCNFPDSYDEYIKTRKSGMPVDLNEHYNKACDKYGVKVTGGATEAEPVNVPFYDKIYNQVTTPLSRDYFDCKTVEFVRQYISAFFREKLDIPLGIQPYNAVYEYMVYMYNEVACDMYQNKGRGSEEYSILLNYTLQKIISEVYQNFSQQIGTLNWRDMSTYTNRLDIPIDTTLNRKELLFIQQTYGNCPPQ